MSATLPPQPAVVPAAHAWPERLYQAGLTLGLGLLGFFVMFSTAGTSIALTLLAALCVASPVRILRTRFWREPLFVTGFALLAYIALRTLLGEGFNSTSFRWINHYQELLVLPLLWAVFANARRPQVFGIGLVLGAVYLAALYWVLGSTMDQTLGLKLHLHRISAGIGLAICAYLLFEHARLGRVPRWAGYVGSALLALTVLVAIDGRTGHLVLLLLVACAGFRAAPARARLPTAAAVLVAAIAVAALSPSVRERALETFRDSEAAHQGQPVPDTSTTIRIEILHNALIVAREHWVTGTGWDHYAQAIAQVARRRHAHPEDVLGALSVNPHNEYLMQLAAGGVPALLLFLAWLACPLWMAARPAAAANPWIGTVASVALAFALGSLFNSLLLDFIEAHLYVAVVAWLLARRRPA